MVIFFKYLVPAFGHSVKLKANLKSRQFQLMVKRHGFKFEIYQRGTLFRSDKLLGGCELKLLPLENKAEIHESLDVRYFLNVSIG